MIAIRVWSETGFVMTSSIPINVPALIIASSDNPPRMIHGTACSGNKGVAEKKGSGVFVL